MSFKCSKCKKQIKKKQPQFKITYTRIYFTEEGTRSEQTLKEDLVCSKCWNESEGKSTNKTKGAKKKK